MITCRRRPRSGNFLMLPTPDRVTSCGEHWFLWFYADPRPGLVREAVLVTVKR